MLANNSGMKRMAWLIALFLSLWCLAGEAMAQARSGRDRSGAERRSGLRQVSTERYTVHTDLDDQQLREVLPRLDRMAAEYAQRTAGISGRSDGRRLPFYLYSDLSAYHRAGGQVGTAGFYDGDRLLAYIGGRADALAWHVIQHEAFHQFLAAKLGRELAPWVNEGLAEYFGESLYTGDGYVSGLTPPWRVQRLREAIQSGAAMPLRELISVTHTDWNERMQQAYYDMAWSLVHFLAHAEGGAGQDHLFALIQSAGRGMSPMRQFEQHIGPVERVQAAWEAYWMELPAEEMRRAYAEAAVQAVCSYGMRAALAGEEIASVEELRDLARRGQLPQREGDVLPQGHLVEVLEWAIPLGQWTLALTPDAKEQVTLVRTGQPPVHARAVVRNGQVVGVESWGQAAAVTEPAGTRPADGRRVRTRTAPVPPTR